MSADLAWFRAVDPALHTAALAELRQGRRQSHWMWFVFPQLRGLGHSATARHFGLLPEEAASCLADPAFAQALAAP